MAAPTLVAVGNGTQQTGSATIVWPTHQTDDIGILYVETAAQPIATPSGWTVIATGSTGTGGAADATALQAFWKRAASGAEADVVLPDAGDHVRGRIIVIRGCETSGSPISGDFAGNVQATPDTAVTIPAGTTLDNECYVLAAVSNATDVTSNQTVTTSWENTTLDNFARIASGNHASGNGGGFDIAAGDLPTAGSWGATTTTLATASVQVRMAFALKPPSGGGGGGTPTSEGGLYVVTGVKVTAGAFGATSGTLDASSAQARVMIALKPPAAPPVNLPPVITAIPNVVGSVDREFSFNVIITDPEGDALTVTLQPGDTDVPSGAVINSNVDGTYDFNWTPTSDQAGEWNIKIRAVDPTPNTTESQFTLTVNATQDPSMLEVAMDIAERAHADLEAAQALCDLLEDHEQMNAKVLHEVRRLTADLQSSVAYMDQVIEDLGEQGSEN